MKYVPLLLLALIGCRNDAASPEPGSGGGVGTGGSMARFTIAADHLYVVRNDGLSAFNISTANNPTRTADIPLNFGIETIFPYRNNLFIGTQTGMYIYGLENPAKPQQRSFFQHIQSCDPVVAQDNYAYVTLRSGTACRNTNINTLDVIDITNLSQPLLKRSYPMRSPHGLGVDGSLLFVTEGDNGLKVFDIRNPLDAKLIQTFPEVRSFDVIPRNNTLIVTGNGGILQYRYEQPSSSQPASLSLLSKLTLE